MRNPHSSDCLLELIDAQFAQSLSEFFKLDSDRSGSSEEKSIAIGQAESFVELIAKLPASESSLPLMVRALLWVWHFDSPWSEPNPTADYRILRGILETLAARFGVDFPLDCQTGESA